MNRYHEEILNCEDIQVDSNYQRVFKPKRAREIARAWDPAIFREPVISRRADGSYMAVDGQHTIAALLIKDGKKAVVPCRVYQDLSLKEEAALFL